MRIISLYYCYYTILLLFYFEDNVKSLQNSTELVSGTNDTTNLNRIYFLKKCSGAGCPYAAAWLSHVNLYRKVGWAMESTKMESASFNMFAII